MIDWDFEHYRAGLRRDPDLTEKGMEYSEKMYAHKNLIEKYQNGDFLSDVELQRLIGDMQLLVDITSKYGDTFFLSRRYALEVLNNCRSFREHRMGGRVVMQSPAKG